MSAINFFVVLSAIVATAWCYGGGAPEAACVDMVPQHAVDPQKSAFPYAVTADKAKVSVSDKVKISISGKEPFKGFLLQVRDGNEAVGTFNIPADDKYSRTADCFSKKQVFTNPLEKQMHYFMRQFVHMINSIASRIAPVDLHRVLYRGEVQNNAATHKNSQEKSKVTVEWVPPHNGKGTYTVHATVAKNGGVFWVNKPTAKITVG